MCSDRVLLGLQAAGVVLALIAAIAWPRPGQAALLVPIGGTDLHGVLRWADREDTALLDLDTSSGRIIARMPDSTAPLHALAAGIIPLATRARGCADGDAP